MSSNLPFDWEMSPRYRVLDSAVRCSHGEGAIQTNWQLRLIKRPTWNYSFLWLRPLDGDNDRGGDAGFVAIDENFDRELVFGAKETLQTQGERIDWIIANGALARRFVLNTRGQLRQDNQRAHEVLTVQRDGVAAWSQRQSWEGTPFRWRQILTPLAGADFVQMPAAMVSAIFSALRPKNRQFFVRAKFRRERAFRARISPVGASANRSAIALARLDKSARLKKANAVNDSFCA